MLLIGWYALLLLEGPKGASYNAKHPAAPGRQSGVATVLPAARASDTESPAYEFMHATAHLDFPSVRAIVASPLAYPYPSTTDVRPQQFAAAVSPPGALPTKNSFNSPPSSRLAPQQVCMVAAHPDPSEHVGSCAGSSRLKVVHMPSTPASPWHAAELLDELQHVCMLMSSKERELKLEFSMEIPETHIVKLQQGSPVKAD